MKGITLRIPKKITLAGLGIIVGSLLFTLLLFESPALHYALGTDIFQTLERKVFDILLRVRGEREHSNDVFLISIDEYSIDKMNNEYPLPRDQVGAVMTILSAYGAKAVALDVFATPSERDTAESALMVEYLSNARNAFQSIGAFIPSETAPELVSRRDVDSTAHFIIGRMGVRAPRENSFPRSPFISEYPFPELAKVSTGVGHTTLIVDTLDGIMRSGPLFIEYAGRLYPALGLALALHSMEIPLDSLRFGYEDGKTYIEAGPLQIETGKMGEVFINFVGPGRVFRDTSFYDILAAAQKQDEKFLNQFKDKVCIIGPTARSIGDYYSMPYSEGAPGYLAHANMYDMIVTDNFIYEASPALQLFLLVALMTAVGLVSTWRRTKAAIITASTLAVAWCIISYGSFAAGNTLLKIAEPLFGITLCFGATLSYRAATEGRQKRMITGMFERYVNPEVVHQLIENPNMLKLGGETKEITLLFSDIKGFTTISEQLGPENLVKLINSYLTEMTSVIMKNQGTVDKFIGDAIMAFWGAPLSDPNSPYHSCVSALEMQSRLEAFQAKWKKLNNISLKQRVGINTGPCIVGNMGSESKFNYTAMGDAVNVASRLEGVNKQYGTYILLSEVTYQKVAKKVVAREVDKVIVVGKTEPIRIYELMGLADRPQSDNTKHFLDAYREGITAYQQRRWDEGIAYFEHALGYVPGDPVSQLYIERMKLYQIHPPEANWNGVFVLSSK